MKRTDVILSAVLSAAALFVSCRSTREVPSEDANAMEIVQMAQTAYDKGYEDDAIYYYNELIMRFGLSSPATYITGRFEIAHIYLKNKDYEKAAPIYEELIGIYNSALPGQLPGSYQKLVFNDYEKIPAKYKKPAEN